MTDQGTLWRKYKWPIALFLLGVFATGVYLLLKALPCGCSSDPRFPFDVLSHYDPSGLVGDIGDIKVEKTDRSVRFWYNAAGQGPHEWDGKYVNAVENPKPAGFSGVMLVDPPNNFGTHPGGYDLHNAQRLTWRACSLTSDDIYVEFLIGGANWTWEKGTAVPSANADSMPRTPLGMRKVTPKCENFSFDLSEKSAQDLLKVIAGFGMVMSWSANGIEPNADRSGPAQPKTLGIQIYDVYYRDAWHGGLQCLRI